MDGDRKVITGINLNAVEINSNPQDQIFNLIFENGKKDRWWKNKSTIIKVLGDLCPVYGFDIIHSTSEIYCQSAGNVRTRSKSGVARQLDGGSIKCGCEWKINLVSDLRLTVADRDAYIEKLALAKNDSIDDQQNCQNVASDASSGTPTYGKRKNNPENHHNAYKLPNTPSRASPARKKIAAHGQRGKKNGKKYPQFFDHVNVKIGKCMFKHTKGCNPSSTQLSLLHMWLKRSGGKA